MFKTLKKHWFLIVCSLIFGLYFAFLGLVFFAPHQDARSRGFVKCTTQMMQQLPLCQKSKIWCTFKIVIKNNYCDFKVVKEGFVLWLDGYEPKPWSYYYFTPTSHEPPVLENGALKEYYQTHQNIVQEMEDLNQKAIELEKQQEKLKHDSVPQ